MVKLKKALNHFFLKWKNIKTKQRKKNQVKNKNFWVGEKGIQNQGKPNKFMTKCVMINVTMFREKIYGIKKLELQ